MPPEKVLFLLKIDYSNQMTCSIVAKRCSMIRMRASNLTAASFLRRLGFIVKNNNNNPPPPHVLLVSAGAPSKFSIFTFTSQKMACRGCGLFLINCP